MQFQSLKNHNLIQGISSVEFKSINPVNQGLKARKRAIDFLKTITKKNISSKDLVFAKQAFSPDAHICLPKDSGKIIKNTDALISNIPGQILGITTADCLPILLFDPKKRVVGAIHGGRQCLIDGIIKNTVNKMIVNFKSSPKDILVCFGPHIRKCHYSLKEKTYQGLKKTGFKKYFIRQKNNNQKEKVYFDMTKLAFDNFIDLGIKKKNMEDCSVCTFCRPEKYFSFRKQEEDLKFNPDKKLIFASFIGLK